MCTVLTSISSNEFWFHNFLKIENEKPTTCKTKFLWHQRNLPADKGVLRNHLSLQVAEYGDLQLQMSYLQSAERLTVVVLKARNLKPLDESKNASKWISLHLSLSMDFYFQ